MILATLLMLSEPVRSLNQTAVPFTAHLCTFIVRFYSLLSASIIKYFIIHMPLTSLLKTCPTFLRLAFVLLFGMALNRLSIQ